MLLSGGSHQLNHGLVVHMPGWETKGYATYPSGVSIEIMNHRVWVLRPLGYKDSPQLGLATISPKSISVQSEDPYVLYISSGPDWEGSIKKRCSLAGVNATIVLIDPCIGGPIMDITQKPTATAISIAAADDRCDGVFASIRCKTWSAATWLPTQDGSPGKPHRDVHNIEGIQRNGKISRAVDEANTESEHTAGFFAACMAHDGWTIPEQPVRRRPGHCVEKHALVSCELATHMFDHPAWARVKRRFGMKEATFEQCMASDETDPERTYAKATALLYSPNASNAIKLLIEPLQCNLSPVERAWEPPCPPGCQRYGRVPYVS